MPEFIIAGSNIKNGERKLLEIPVAALFDMTQLSLSLEVIRGEKEGPIMFVSAAIHGDEVIGAEIVKRLLARKELLNIQGILICIPIVNPYGYNNNIRYLPDRRDLNRCFPGSPNGSLAARIAHTFLNEVVVKCNYGIDIHSGAIHRTNFPQIRLELKDPEEIKLARAFGAPVILNSPLRPGTLRKAAQEKGVKTILYEGGEALRFDEHAINVAVNGVLNVMREIGMLQKKKDKGMPIPVMTARSSHWIRAQNSGSLTILKNLGAFVQTGELLGVVSDPFGRKQTYVTASQTGIIVGEITMPLVNKGDALFHVATLEDMKFVDETSVKDIVLDQDIDIENEDWFIRS